MLVSVAPRFARRLSLALTACAALASPMASQAQAQAQTQLGLTPLQRAEVVEVLRDALKRDPSILREALAAMQEAETRDRATSQRGAILAQREALLADPADPVKGNPQGNLTIVEFFDARCGYCKALHPTLQALLRADPQIRVVMKDLPILGPASVVASRALLAAQRQGKYAAFQDALMQLRGEPTEAALQAEAQKLGIDWVRAKRDMEDPAILARLQHNVGLARALSIEGTPALVIGNTLVPGAVDLPTLQNLVAQARQEARQGG
ncbi:disulfide bond formation protein DsbA [Pseudoroseomonas deserti]|uniref:Disulfide bond formation protein DsbA n=2 Tax=Teichococcus deserti TaxID=1817963 RepID=A0A1V2GZ68_9PROT|nr:disulfide bond formation protein DsbA [Pseudoroseomonas deserti]